MMDPQTGELYDISDKEFKKKIDELWKGQVADGTKLTAEEKAEQLGWHKFYVGEVLTFKGHHFSIVEFDRETIRIRMIQPT